MENQRNKILLVGESCVGKTSLINRIIENIYYEETSASASYSYSSKEIVINTSTIKLNFWDTPGLQKYRSFLRIFFKNTKVVLLVYDVRYRRTFEEIKSFHYPYLKSLAEDASIIINYLLFIL